MGTEEQNALLPHLERALGSFAGEGYAEPEWNIPFSAFRWLSSPEPGINTLVSFGLGRHLFEGVGRSFCWRFVRPGTRLQWTSS